MRFKKKIFIICVAILFNLTKVYADSWFAEVKCTLISIKNKGMDHRNGDYVYGKGYGKTEQDAIKAAKHDINKNYVP